MNRRSFLSLSALGAFAALTAGCALLRAPAETVPIERVGVCSWSFQEPLAQVDVRMREMGVKGIQLSLTPFIAPDGRHGAAEGSAALALVKQRVAAGDWVLMSTMIGFPQEDYSTLETIRKTGGIVPDAEWPRNQELVRHAAKLTKELGAPYLSLHAGFLDERDPKAYATFVERVTWIRDECARNGITLLLESGQETAEDLAAFLADVPGVGVNLDPANMILYGKGDPLAALATLMPWIKQVHVKDAIPTDKPGTWGTETPWGEGKVGGRAFVAALDRLGYQGNFLIEREGGNRRAEDIALAVRRLTK